MKKKPKASPVGALRVTIRLDASRLLRELERMERRLEIRGCALRGLFYAYRFPS